MTVQTELKTNTDPLTRAPAGNRRMTASAVIDFPEPEAPTNPRTSPGATWSDTLSRIRSLPIDTQSESIVRSGADIMTRAAGASRRPRD